MQAKEEVVKGTPAGDASGTPVGQPPDENDWFFDMIIGFLRSPRWKTPIMSFIDEYCVVFDDEDENKLEFTKVHSDFKKIVEDLLEELMKELGVSEEQFMEACEKAEKNPLHKKIVDQIVAVENFLAFKRLMVKRNQELNKQAVELFNRVQAKEEAKAKPADSETPTPAAGPTEETKQGEPGAETTAAASENPTKAALSEEMKAVMKVARQAELAEEEAMMKAALAESERQAEDLKRAETSEEDMIRKAIEESEQMEKERIQRQKTMEGTDAAQMNLAQASSAEAAALHSAQQKLEEKAKELEDLKQRQLMEAKAQEFNLKQKELALQQKEKSFEEFKRQETANLEAEKARLAKEREELIAKAKAEGLNQAQAEARAEEIMMSQPQAADPNIAAAIQAPPVRAEAPKPVAVTQPPVEAPKAATAAAPAQLSKASMPPPAKIKSDMPKPSSDFPSIGGGLPSIGGGLPSIGGGGSGFPSLGGIGGRGGRFEYDEGTRKAAMAELAKMNRDLDAGVPDDEEEEKKEDTRSFMEIMREKNAKAEQENASKKAVAGQETVEERKARLLAQRDLLRKMNEEKRQKELQEFNQQIEKDAAVGAQTLADEFKRMDTNKQKPSLDADLERRRQIYKNVRKDIERDEKAQKEQTLQKKMTQLESKMEQKDEERRKRNEQERVEAQEAADRRQANENQKKNFLDNLQAFKVD